MKIFSSNIISQMHRAMLGPLELQWLHKGRCSEVVAAAGKAHMAGPRRIFDRQGVSRLRDVEGVSWPEIARRTGAGVETAVRA